jgi:hypothetical protein
MEQYGKWHIPGNLTSNPFGHHCKEIIAICINIEATRDYQ